jgi:hypothetical protein
MRRKERGRLRVLTTERELAEASLPMLSSQSAVSVATPTVMNGIVPAPTP